MKYQIRPLEVKDINQIIKGETEVFGTSLGYDLIYSDLKINPYANYLALEIGRKIQGYIGLWINEENAEIINFYVARNFQGMGFGKLLLEFALELCKISKVKSISLEVRENNDRAIRLYEKYGFEFSHKRLNYYQDLTHALVLIKKFEVI